MPYLTAALLVAVLVTVALPYLVTRSTTNAALLAREWMSHSAQVRADVYQLAYRLRDMESAIYSLLQGVDRASLAPRLAVAQKQIEPLLHELRGLTIDNPDQQLRLGAFSATVKQRLEYMQKAQADYTGGNVAAAYRDLATAANMFHYSDQADAIVAAESALLTARSAKAAHKTRISHRILIATTLAQLLILVMVVVAAERAISHRLRAERISRQAVLRAQRIVQTVREPIAVLDDKLDMVMVNTAFAELYASDAVQDGKQALANSGEGAWDDAALLQRLADVIARDRELWDYELAQTTADGVQRHMLINARRMQMPQDDTPTLLLSVSDVTARTFAENEISALNRQLEGKVEQVSDINRELEAFSYSVSHDLRAPLRHIAGFSDKLTQHLGHNIDPKASHYLDVIGDAARRMAQLIDDLLIYSRFGRTALRMQPVDMQSLADQARAMAMADADTRNIAWRIAPLPVVIGDENMLRTVWENLINNAVKYSAQREQAMIEVSVEHAARGDYVFTIKDNGAGFDMQYADKLFGVFQRLHKSSDFPGSGIGLANVKRIISRHGGRVWAEAQLDQGASFHFSLPELNTAPAT
ncbi:MAG: ATP-binding protein [Xanthomonadales bacterium]|nr:ATP-binding protein [Xanthomonadales bacterium]